MKVVEKGENRYRIFKGILRKNGFRIRNQIRGNNCRIDASVHTQSRFGKRNRKRFEGDYFLGSFNDCMLADCLYF